MSIKKSVVSTSNETLVSDNVSLSKGYDFKTISGVDTLYSYYPSNEAYRDFFESLAQKILSAKEQYDGFIPKDTLRIVIGDKEFFFNGMSKGYYFFIDTARWFRIGLKHPSQNTKLLDIQVQCEATGIYLLGLVGLIRYIEALVSPIANICSQLTRMDGNIFVQFDLSSVIEKDFIISKKRKNRREDGGRRGYQSLKIGDNPFLARFYDKRIELIGKEKRSLMEAYFVFHGFDLNKPIWNFEFEWHRDFFKRYGIRTVEDGLKNVEILFHHCMKIIRFVDKTTLSQKDLEANRWHRAKTHPLWEYIDQSYTFNAIPQSYEALEKIIPKKSVYNSKVFMMEFQNLLNKGVENDVYLSQENVQEILKRSGLWFTERTKKLLKPFKPLPLIVDGVNYVLSRNRTPIKTLPANLTLISTYKLKQFEASLLKALHSEFTEQDWDISLITKNLKAIESEIKKRKYEQSELELWQA
ncbi:hypothetical protein SJPD1_1015 [Sulfurospirillum diekertiae]|uniref:Replication initiation factor n=1 Tax=Sulfurospirillum diekertiae TaxID=1854492 RepID=A0A290HCE0_9BACT|nr:hypothetical protein [Sulfurospirillum diekertiae]ATB69127.1 hypothetical protein SJPD1_1015 [Sulfurospirillum diekertiae]